MADDIDRVWELMQRFSICMMSTWNGSELHVWPMAANLARERNIRLLTVTPVGVEYRDGRGKVASMIGMPLVAATGSRPNIGKNEKVSMT
jgi:hypothetical protein